MNNLDLFVSTRQAAQILNVHESSIKRWCNDGMMPVRLTRGGHRRLRFADVMDFARSEKIVSTLLAFAPNERDVWMAIQEASKGQFKEIATLLFNSTEANRESFAQQLTLLLLDSGVSVGTLFDEVFGPVLRKIGEDWLAGVITTGDEHRMTQILGDCIASVRNRRPVLTSTKPLALVACAPGEDHELGALMVRAALEYNGWQTVYLGRNVPAEDIATQQDKWDVRLVGISFVPPHGPADAVMLVRALARMYDPAKPYSLAVGGGSILSQDLQIPEYPFSQLDRFGSITAFNEWARSVASELAKEPQVAVPENVA